MLVRGDSLARSMSDYLIREIEATPNIAVHLHTEVTDGHGDDQLEALTLCSNRVGRAERVAADALFVLIGGEPRTQWLPETMQRSYGYIRTGRDVRPDGPYPARWPLHRPPLPLETSIPGVFAAGDARCRSIKRVASAVGDGAAAVRLAHEYLSAAKGDELAEVAGEGTDPFGLLAGDGAAQPGPAGQPASAGPARRG
jgi:thioredoxin reductase (NADPH)